MTPATINHLAKHGNMTQLTAAEYQRVRGFAKPVPFARDMTNRKPIGRWKNHPKRQLESTFDKINGAFFCHLPERFHLHIG